MEKSKHKNNYDDLTYVALSRCDNLRAQVCRELNWMTIHPHTDRTHNQYLVRIDIAYGLIEIIKEVACWADEKVCDAISDDAHFLEEMVKAFQKLAKDAK